MADDSTPSFALTAGGPFRTRSDVLVLFTDESPKPAAPLDAVDRALDGKLLRAAREEGFRGKADQTFVFHTHGRLSAERIVVAGLGPAAQRDGERLRAKTVTLAVPAVNGAAAVQAVAEGAALGAYQFDRYRTNGRDERVDLQSVRLLLPEGVDRTRVAEQALAAALRVAGAANFARTLVNEPAAHLTPEKLAEEAAAVGKTHRLQVKVSGPKELKRLRMGMFSAVGQGSTNGPRLIELAYRPKKTADQRRQPVALVGKAITFDSGGLSLKTAEGMADMKTDMAGSAAVLGAMSVVATLAPPFPVIGYLGAAENMPSGEAYRPGDVLISRLGKTVEVTNTDAEGRLVLGDVLSYAVEQKPSAVIDLATLTGACVVALGLWMGGAFSNDDALAEEVLTAARRAGESFWRMPLIELQKETLRSEVADMKNAGDRWGGAITAAVFLKEFVGQTPWVHLDIAGTSQAMRERGYQSKGATGVGVRTLVEFLKGRATRDG